MAVLLDACTAAGTPASVTTALDDHLTDHRAWAGDHPAPPSALRHALTVWTRLHGVLSLELTGHFTGMGFDPAQLYAAEIDSLTRC
jgi:hypothetical protein